MKFYKGSIEKKLLNIIVLTTSVAILSGYFVFVGWYIHQQKAKDIELSRVISNVISQDVAKILYFDDISAATDVTQNLKSFANLEGIVLYKKDTTQFFQYFKKAKLQKINIFNKNECPSVKSEGKRLYICTKLFYQGTFLAYAQYYFSTETLIDIFFDNLLFLLLALFFVNIIAYILAKYYAKHFTNPILKLVQFLEQIKNENYLTDRVVTNEDNEFGLLYEEINTMLERLEASHQNLKIAAVAFDINNGMLITDKNSKILQVNKAFEELTGYSKDEVIGKKPSLLKSGKHNDAFYKNMYKELANNNFFASEIINRKKDGTFITEEFTIRTVRNDTGEIIYYVASFFDISIQKEMEKKLEYLEKYEQLTGLINRKYLIQMLQNEINKQQAYKSCAFICMDIEKFKILNEAYGFHFGNKILKAISERLLKDFSYAKCIAKIGADEFLLWFVYEYQDINDVASYAKAEAEKILTTITKPYNIEGVTVDISAYIGIDIRSGKEIASAESVVKQSVSAVSIAKEKHQRVAFYDVKYQDKSLQYLNMHTKLLKAIKEQEFRLFYQMQHNEKAEPIGAEALMRWVQKDGTVIPPVKFIPFLEESGLILQLTEWIVDTACKQLSQWQKDEKTKHLSISINATSQEFNHDDFVSTIVFYLKKYNVAKGLLKVELTESVLVNDKEKVIDKMNKLRATGVKISLDDFGTGFSSLSYLKDLPIDQIKIDQTFIKNIQKDEKDVAIVKSVLVLGEAFHVNVIAEGVETQEDFELLNHLHCKMYQGYYLAKPKPIEEITI